MGTCLVGASANSPAPPMFVARGVGCDIEIAERHRNESSASATSGSAMSEIAARFQLAQSWWIATELVRRHPKITVIETHAGGGMYDSLSLLRDGTNILTINRGGHIHAHLHPMEPVRLTCAFLDDDAHELIWHLEKACGLSTPAKAPATTPKTLTYRVLTYLCMATVNKSVPLDIRSAYNDTSGMGGGSRNLLPKFPIAAERARERRSDDPFGVPEHRYWLVLRDSHALAAVDVDGHAYLGAQVLHLPTAYEQTDRNVTRTVAATLSSLLP